MPCADSVMAWIQQGKGCRWLACFNPHSYVVSLDNAAFAHALRNADWLVPDGVGIVLASRFLGGELRERVTGSDVFREVHKRLNETGGSVFLLGASEETLQNIRAKLNRDYPNVRVTGSFSPPYKAEFSKQDSEAMLATINAVSPDILWVGMTSPKQDLWLYENRVHLNAKVAAAVGAVFDFYAGRIKRSPRFFQQIGLEWLPRLLQEPRRLWRRNFISTPVFVWHVLRQKLAGDG